MSFESDTFNPDSFIRKIQKMGNIESVSECIGEKLADFFTFDYNFIIHINEDESSFNVINLTSTISNQLQQTPVTMPIKGSWIETIVATGKGKVIKDVSKDECLCTIKMFVENWVESIVLAPLISAGKVIGTLNVCSVL